MTLRPRSVRTRLTLWYASVVAVIVAAFCVAVYLIVRASLLHEVEERAEQNVAVIQRLVTDDPRDAEEIEEHGIVSLFAILRDGAPTYVSTAWQRQGLPEVASIALDSQFHRWQSDAGRHFGIAGSTSTVADGSLTIFAAVDEDSVLDHLRTLGLVLLVGFPAAIAAAVAGGSFLAKRLLSPVAAMADAAGQITADRLSDRLPIDDPEDEFGRLAAVFNATLARLQDAFERLRRFTADASHELRTPLTALRSVGEVALQGPTTPERLRETIVSMLEENERLTELVDGLLTLTRENTEAYRARFAPVDLSTLASEVVELFRPLAEEKSQRIDVVHGGFVHGVAVHDGIAQDGAIHPKVVRNGPVQTEPSMVFGDRMTLRHALLNLVDNAIKHTPPGGTIRVRAAQSDVGETIVEVIDDGPGIAPEHHQKIFERFYRVDHARSRSTGGAGLGLAIARWAIELNGGRLELESRSGEGSTFRARFPASSAATRVDARHPTATINSGGSS